MHPRLMKQATVSTHSYDVPGGQWAEKPMPERRPVRRDSDGRAMSAL